MNKHYTIPTLDFSYETFRQTIVDKENGLYIGHPTTVLLEDGKTIVIAYPKNHGFGQIVIKKSYDGGLTWSDRLPVPESFSTSMEVPTIFRVIDKKGVKRLILFSGLRPNRMSVSEDDGDTWTELLPISKGGGITVMGDIAKVGDGEYIALFHDDGRFMRDGINRKTVIEKTGHGSEARTRARHCYSTDNGKTWGDLEENWVKTLEKEGDIWTPIYESFCDRAYDDGHFVMYQVKSIDGGLTWSEPKVIGESYDTQLCEPAIIRSPDGKQLVSLWRENARAKNSCMMISDDNGDSWGEPIEVTASLTGDRHCARYLKDGRLFISFRDLTHESPTKNDWVAWVGTYDDIVNRREGQYRIRLMKNYKSADCGYPGVEVLPDGTVVATTYGHFAEGEEAYVVSVRIHPDEFEKAKRIN